MATFSEDFLSCILGCDSSDLFIKLNSISAEAKDVFNACKNDLSFDSIVKSVHSLAVENLTALYRSACENFDSGQRGVYKEDETELLREALDFLNPRDDLKIEIDSDQIVLELDYWDLYASVVEELSSVKYWSFKDFLDCFTYVVYSGKEVPQKFQDILL